MAGAGQPRAAIMYANTAAAQTERSFLSGFSTCAHQTASTRDLVQRLTVQGFH